MCAELRKLIKSQHEVEHELTTPKVVHPTGPTSMSSHKDPQKLLMNYLMKSERAQKRDFIRNSDSRYSLTEGIRGGIVRGASRTQNHIKGLMTSIDQPSNYKLLRMVYKLVKQSIFSKNTLFYLIMSSLFYYIIFSNRYFFWAFWQIYKRTGFLIKWIQLTQTQHTGLFWNIPKSLVIL